MTKRKETRSNLPTLATYKINAQNESGIDAIYSSLNVLVTGSYQTHGRPSYIRHLETRKAWSLERSISCSGPLEFQNGRRELPRKSESIVGSCFVINVKRTDAAFS